MRRLYAVFRAASKCTRYPPSTVTRRNYAAVLAKPGSIHTSFFDGKRSVEAVVARPEELSSSSSSTPIPLRLLEINHYNQAQPLLRYLSRHFADLKSNDIYTVVAPAISALVRSRHYAGAREVTEAIFERCLSEAQPGTQRWRMSTSLLKRLLRSIFDQDFSASMSVSAIDALLGYILDTVSTTQLQAVNMDTIRLLTLHKQYISIPNLDKIVSLLGQIDAKAAGLEDPARRVPLLHSIMNVYSMHGDTETAETWMSAIKQTEKDMLEYQQAALVSEARPSSITDTVKSSKRTASANRPSTAIQLGTTYITSFGRSSFHFIDDDGYSSRSKTGDSSTAMAFFDILRNAKMNVHTLTNGSEVANAPSPRSLDIYAWTAILNVAGRDTERVSTQALMQVFDRLKSDPSLPNPNIVTYTVLLSALIARDRARQAMDIFESEILRLVLNKQLELDTMALQQYITACSRTNGIEKAGEIVRWFAKKAGTEGQDVASSDSIASSDRPWDILSSSVQLDVQLINSYLTMLAKEGMFATLFSVYAEMQSTFSVIPDEITLSILAKAAISHGARRAGGGVPTRAEDAYLSMNGSRSLRRRHKEAATGVDEMQLWSKKEPFVYVRNMFWAMLSENYPLASRRARDSMLSPSRRFLLGSPPPSTSTTPQTHRLSSPAYHKDALPYPHLSPSRANMHLFIALLGYFSASREIPLVLAYMRELQIVPTRRTLCLALWSFEEGGAYAKERRSLERWLVAWLGQSRVPTDDEIATFRKKQRGD